MWTDKWTTRTKVQWMVYVCWFGSCVGFRCVTVFTSVSCRILFQLNLFPPHNHLMIPLWALPYRLNIALKTTFKHCGSSFIVSWFELKFDVKIISAIATIWIINVVFHYKFTKVQLHWVLKFTFNIWFFDDLKS